MKRVKDSRILLTGAAGFIGSHLGNTLHSMGAYVVGMDNYSNPSKNPLHFPVRRGNVRREKDIFKTAYGADVIVHLAALISVDESVLRPRAMVETNIGGTLNVLEVARKLDLRVVFASSSEVYGTSQTEPMNESHPLEARSPYAATKVAGDRMCKAWKDTYGLDVNIVRGFNTYGPFQNPGLYGGVIAKFVRQAWNGKPMTIFGDGTQSRDFMAVSDSVDAYLLALRTKFPGPVNFGTGEAVSVLDLARKIAVYLDIGGEPWTFLKPRPGDVQTLRADNSLAHSLGWHPKVSFDEGLADYINWATI